MDLTVGIITWKAKQMLADLLNSLATGLQGVDAEVLVVDNASADGTVEMVKSDYPFVTLLENATNRGVAPARNQILGPGRGRYLVFLDVDTLVPPGSMKTLLQVMDAHPEAGIGGPRLVYRDGRLQLSCRPFPKLSNIIVEGTFLRSYFPNSRFVKEYTKEDWGHGELCEVDWMYGACLIVRRELFARLGGFDEGYFYLYEDVDLCLRAKCLGHKVIYIPQATVTHFLEREQKPIFHPLFKEHLKSIFRYLWRKNFQYRYAGGD